MQFCPHRFRILGGQYSPTTRTTLQPTPADDYININSQFILFLSLLLILFLIICLIALNAAARCTCFRWFSGTVITSQIDHFSLPATKLLRTIPKLTYSGESLTENFSDCAICLTEFVVGDEIRVLPVCSHCFHVACIDRWIASHFTCPSCRQMLLKTVRCDRCDEAPVAGVTGTRATAAGERSVTIDRFLP